MVNRFESFVSSIACISRYIQKIERDVMVNYGLKGPHAQCMLAMSRFPEGITSTQLCEICDKDKAAVSRTVSELEQAGMVSLDERNGTRYRALLKLTPKGEAAARAVSERAHVAVEQAGIGLDDSQRQVFYQVLGLISRNLHTICKNGLSK
jgi:DNA-binding MarR family transcriptional regulator